MPFGGDEGDPGSLAHDRRCTKFLAALKHCGEAASPDKTAAPPISLRLGGRGTYTPRLWERSANIGRCGVSCTSAALTGFPLRGFHGRRHRVYTHRWWNARRYPLVFVVCSYSALLCIPPPTVPPPPPPVEPSPAADANPCRRSIPSFTYAKNAPRVAPCKHGTATYCVPRRDARGGPGNGKTVC